MTYFGKLVIGLKNLAELSLFMDNRNISEEAFVKLVEIIQDLPIAYEVFMNFRNCFRDEKRKNETKYETAFQRKFYYSNLGFF